MIIVKYINPYHIVTSFRVIRHFAFIASRENDIPNQAMRENE